MELTLAGLLTMDNLGEFPAIRSALGEPAQRRWTGPIQAAQGRGEPQ